MQITLPNRPNAQGLLSHFSPCLAQSITPLPKLSAQMGLMVSLSLAAAVPAFAEQNQPSPLTVTAPPITPASAPTANSPSMQPSVISTSSQMPSQTPLPNAFELVQKIEAQNLEIARLAGELEQLQAHLSDIDNHTLSKTEFESRLKNELAQRDDILRQQIETYIEARIQTQVETQIAMQLETPLSSSVSSMPSANPLGSTTDSQTNSQVSKSRYNTVAKTNQAVNRPFLPKPQRIDATVLTNNDIPTPVTQPSAKEAQLATTLAIDPTLDNASPRNPLSLSNSTTKISQGEAAYANAYLALQEKGVAVAVQKMQTFIATYANHPRLPDAHYWLGEFELKQKPANVSAAEDNFQMVVGKYADNPNNDKQSKALYRLATLAKSKGRMQLAKDYRTRLLLQYPESIEATLLQKTNW